MSRHFTNGSVVAGQACQQRVPVGCGTTPEDRDVCPDTYVAMLKLTLAGCRNRWLGDSSGFVDMLVKFVPSPIEGAKMKCATTYSGPQDSPIATDISRCHARAPSQAYVSPIICV